jgi:hypothetical protein
MTYQHAGELLGFLLATPAAPDALAILLDLLERPHLPPAAYDPLVESLAYASSWVPARLELETLVALAECPHLDGKRERLLHRTIEPAIFAQPAALSVPILERLCRLYAGHPSLRYCLYYLAGRPDVPDGVRSMAAAATTGQFSLHAPVARQLGQGTARILVVQNIADKQGDEIIRVVPLLDALLCFNPLLEVVLITGRAYLYTHSRVTPVPIEEQARTGAVLRERFDGVIDFYEPVVPEVNYDRELERLLQAYVKAHAPFLYLASLKGWNHFVYQRVDVQSHPYAAALGLNLQRIANVYETTFRLIAELGLPLRLGEEPPVADAILAGLPCHQAGAAWSGLVSRNAQRRPVAPAPPAQPTLVILTVPVSVEKLTRCCHTSSSRLVTWLSG